MVGSAVLEDLIPFASNEQPGWGGLKEVRRKLAVPNHTFATTQASRSHPLGQRTPTAPVQDRSTRTDCRLARATRQRKWLIGPAGRGRVRPATTAEDRKLGDVSFGIDAEAAVRKQPPGELLDRPESIDQGFRYGKF
jgi:hypothetical protein